MLRVLITGGTGTLGHALTKRLLNDGYEVKIYSRDEFKQKEMAQIYPDCKYYIGDVRDLLRLNRAMREVDIVIHAAALKRIDTAYYNPFEMIKTNILGTQNVIDCALENNLLKAVFISSDKAVEPINLYGSTKLCGEKMFESANNHKGKNKTIFTFVRYGNVFGSRGSVIDIWAKQNPIIQRGVDVTRFHLTVEDAVNIILESMARETDVIPLDLKAYSLDHLATAFCKVTGKKKEYDTSYYPDEKKHEKLDHDVWSFEAEAVTDKELELLIKKHLDKAISA